MNDLTIRLLDKSNPDEIKAYEKSLYMAFSSIVDSSLELLWNVGTVKKRISTKIPYSSQQIMVAEQNGSIIAGFAMNLNMQEMLQLEYFDFKINKSEPGICEGLLLFNTQISATSHVILLGLKEHLISYLRSQNIHRVYGTCTKRRIRGYRFLGFKDIDMKLFDGKPEYLLYYDI